MAGWPQRRRKVHHHPPPYRHFPAGQRHRGRPIGRSRSDRKKMAVVAEGRPAVTHWEVLARYPGVTHLRCRLETGRTHQIRVHLAYIGHPILGDTVYGNRKPVPGLTGQCLHATGLRFLHPRTGCPVELTCPRPEEFERMLTKLQSAPESKHAGRGRGKTTPSPFL